MYFLRLFSVANVEVVDGKDGTYRATFKPTKSGRYCFDLGLVAKRNNCVRIRGSPMEISVILSTDGKYNEKSKYEAIFNGTLDVAIDTRHSSIDKALLYGNRVGDTIKIIIQAKGKSGRTISVGGAKFIAYLSTPSMKGKFVK